MSMDHRRFLEFYQAHRYEDQKTFYQNRAAEFTAAYRQSLRLTAVLSVLTTLVASLAASNVVGPALLWKVLAVILPLLTTALSAYIAVYAFDRQAKLYHDAINALIRAGVEAPDIAVPANDLDQQEALAQYVVRIEDILQRENNQWGQLVSQIQLNERPSDGSKQSSHQ